MKVTLATQGGLTAPINRRLPPRVVDTETLPKEAERELAQLVEAAKTAQAAREEEPAKDAMSYTITVEDVGRSTVLTQPDTTMSPAFSALLTWLERRLATE